MLNFDGVFFHFLFVDLQQSRSLLLQPSDADLVVEFVSGERAGPRLEAFFEFHVGFEFDGDDDVGVALFVVLYRATILADGLHVATHRCFGLLYRRLRRVCSAECSSRRKTWSAPLSLTAAHRLLALLAHCSVTSAVFGRQSS